MVLILIENGKWSLPLWSQKILHSILGEYWGEEREMSTLVKDEWVEKWVGVPLLNNGRWWFVMRFSIIKLLEFDLGELQSGF